MAGYIGSKASVTQVDGYNRTEADSEFVQVTGDTMTGNLDISGTVTATDLTLDSGSSSSVILQDSTGTNGYQLRANVSSSNDYGFLLEDLSGSNIALFDSGGDISFYEDTGTTPKFFWDASAESLGIGTQSPATKLDVNGNVTANQFIGGGTIINVGSLSDGTNYTTTSVNYQTATRFQITPTTSTSRLLGWFFCQMRATSGTNITDGDMGSTARAHHVNSSGSWSAVGSLAQNLRTENGTSTGLQEIAVTFPILLNQSDLDPTGVWDVAIRHYEVYDAKSNIDDGRLFYMEYEP